MGECRGGGDEGAGGGMMGEGARAHRKGWVSITTHPPPLPTLPTTSPKNLLHVLEKVGDSEEYVE